MKETKSCGNCSLTCIPPCDHCNKDNVHPSWYSNTYRPFKFVDIATDISDSDKVKYRVIYKITS